MALLAVGSALAVGAGTAHADRLPFPGGGYVSVGGPAAPGQVVELTVKERPGNPHPTAVDVSSPALTNDTTLGDTGRAWVGSGRIKGKTESGTYKVKFMLRHKDADCVTEGDQDYVCDYPPIALEGQLKVAPAAAASEKEPAFGTGIAIGAASGVLATTLVAGALLVRRKRRTTVSDPL